MCRLIESIRVENKQLCNIEWHNKRFNKALKDLFGIDTNFDLSKAIYIPEDMSTEIYKCRILYKRQIESIEFQPYTIRSIKTLKLIEDDTIEYSYKYKNREVFTRLMEKRGEADDILIIKNGCITDTSYSNIVFFDGKQWFTPDTYLLNGTQRQRLIAEGLIQEKHITTSDLENFSFIKPINAMLDFDKTACVDIIN